MLAFNRLCRLDIYLLEQDTPISIYGGNGLFRIEFNCHKTLTSQPNTMEVVVYNLNKDTRDKLTSLKSYMYFLYVGYVGAGTVPKSDGTQDADSLFLLMCGDIQSVRSDKVGTEWKTILGAEDGKDVRQKVSTSFPKGTTLDKKLKDVVPEKYTVKAGSQKKSYAAVFKDSLAKISPTSAEDAGGTNKGAGGGDKYVVSSGDKNKSLAAYVIDIASGSIEDALAKISSKVGEAVEGQSKQITDDLLKKYGLIGSVQDGRFEVSLAGYAIDDGGPELNFTNGLLVAPRPIDFHLMRGKLDPGIEFKTMLLPNLIPAHAIRVEGYNPHKIISVRIQGDTHSDQWSADIQARVEVPSETKPTAVIKKVPKSDKTNKLPPSEE